MAGPKQKDRRTIKLSKDAKQHPVHYFKVQAKKVDLALPDDERTPVPKIDPADRSLRWLLARAQVRSERKGYDEIVDAEILSYLPVETRWRKGVRGRHAVERPLLRGYLFFALPEEAFSLKYKGDLLTQVNAFRHVGKVNWLSPELSRALAGILFRIAAEQDGGAYDDPGSTNRKPVGPAYQKGDIVQVRMRFEAEVGTIIDCSGSRARVDVRGHRMNVPLADLESA